MDETDLLALQLLARHGRMTWAELAGHLALSNPAAAERVRRLEERGAILGYGAIVHRESVDYGLTAFVDVDLADNSKRAAFLKRVASMPEVLECHHVTGDHDFLIKIVCRNPKHLDALLNEQLKHGNTVARTRTTIVLGSPKEVLFIPPDTV